jgi:hypothetical protein
MRMTASETFETFGAPPFAAMVVESLMKSLIKN